MPTTLRLNSLEVVGMSATVRVVDGIELRSSIYELRKTI